MSILKELRQLNEAGPSKVYIRLGLTEIVLNKRAKTLTVTHNGNMGDTKKMVAANVDEFLSRGAFNRLARVGKETGSPSYSYALSTSFDDAKSALGEKDWVKVIAKAGMEKSIVKPIKEEIRATASSGSFVWLAYVDTEQGGSIDLNDLDTIEVHLSEESAVRSMIVMMDQDIDGSSDAKLQAAAAKVKTERQLADLVEKFDDELGHYQDLYVITKVQVK
jgi:hypothetical protein